MKENKPVKKHIKMYGGEEINQQVKLAADKEGLTQSAYILIAVKKELRKNK